LLLDSGFEFSAAEDARVLTGKEEGLWGWLAVNYATGALQVCWAIADYMYGTLCYLIQSSSRLIECGTSKVPLADAMPAPRASLALDNRHDKFKV
jgi:hypothetical protein